MLFGPLRSAVFQLEVPPANHSVRAIFVESRLIDRFTGYEMVLSIGKVADKILAPQSFGENDVRHRYSQCRIFSRHDR